MISSSPVERTPTVGHGWTRSCSTPMLESTPMWAAPRYVPGEKTSSPARISPPAFRTNVPGSTDSSTTTIDPPDSTRVRSTMHTASAPGGSGAPVMIRTDSPADTNVFASSPAITLPTTRRRAGADARIGGPDGVAVHGRIGKGRHGLGSSDGFGQHMTRGVAHRHSPGGEDFAGGEDELASLGDGDHRGEGGGVDGTRRFTGMMVPTTRERHEGSPAQCCDPVSRG